MNLKGIDHIRKVTSFRTEKSASSQQLMQYVTCSYVCIVTIKHNWVATKNTNANKIYKILSLLQ